VRPPVSNSRISGARFAIFCCPICGEDLAPADRRLGCGRGHNFDLANSGYVNLARPRRHAPAAGGDTRAQLEQRAHFLARGHFDPIADVIAEEMAAMDVDTGGHVLDAGCGTGFHLARATARLGAAGSGIDMSKDAAAWCGRRYPESSFAVADIWNHWPIRSRSVDLLLSIFAPKNYAEMARVLRPGGTLALAFPGPQHFIELRRAFALLAVPARKREHYAARLALPFEQVAHRRVRKRVTLQGQDICDAILMGPNAARGPEPSAFATQMDVSIDIEFLFARKPRLIG
jgi:SAM-dependent methyltransferase